MLAVHCCNCTFFSNPDDAFWVRCSEAHSTHTGTSPSPLPLYSAQWYPPPALLSLGCVPAWTVSLNSLQRKLRFPARHLRPFLKWPRPLLQPELSPLSNRAPVGVTEPAAPCSQSPFQFIFTTESLLVLSPAQHTCPLLISHSNSAYPLASSSALPEAFLDCCHSSLPLLHS